MQRYRPLTIVGYGNGRSSPNYTLQYSLTLQMDKKQSRLSKPAEINKGCILDTTSIGRCHSCREKLIPSMHADKYICILRCGHMCHSYCIEQLFRKKGKCATCRKDTIQFWPHDYANIRRILQRKLKIQRTDTRRQ